MAIVTDIRNFHAHVYFDPDASGTAERVHGALAHSFGVTLGALVGHPIGPHTKGMFQVTLEPDQFATIVPWLMLHRDGLSVLVHPTTDDDVIADHVSNALWMGEALPIDVERVRELARTMHTKNDSDKNESEGSVMSATHEDGHGGHITILEHGSATAPMRFRAVQPKGVAPPAPECHPSQTEDFKVLRGTLDLGVIDGKRVLLNAGDTFHLPAGVYHLPRNGGDGELEYDSVLTPGLESADMFTDLYPVLRERRGLAQVVGVSIVFLRYTSSIQFKAPVRFAMTVVSAVARLFGFGTVSLRRHRADVPGAAHSDR